MIITTTTNTTIATITPTLELLLLSDCEDESVGEFKDVGVGEFKGEAALITVAATTAIVVLILVVASDAMIVAVLILILVIVTAVDVLVNSTNTQRHAITATCKLYVKMQGQSEAA